MDAAYVTGSGAITTIVSGGDTTVVDGISHVTGIELKGSTTASDPRVSGTTALHLTGLGAPSAAGGVGFEWGTMRIENAGGAWQGTVSGGVWEDANASDLAGWLAGSGAYQGLTYYIHVRGGTSADSVGVILPVPVPTP